MHTLAPAQRCAVIRCLVDGCSIRATTRITGIAKNTIQKLTRDLGAAVLEYHDNVVRGVKSKRVQADEIWCFCHTKDKNLPDSMRGEHGVGSVWTWTALDADSKLMVSWRLGARDAANAVMFINDLQSRLAGHIQLTTDGNKLYINPVMDTFPTVDYAMLQKMYGKGDGEYGPERTYSPAKCNGIKKKVLVGAPAEEDISTSYAERQNLNIRMNNRRYTRLTNAFSKKFEMLQFSVAITFFYHNFVRRHQTLGMTPAEKAGIANHQWTIEEMVGLLPEAVYPNRSEG